MKKKIISFVVALALVISSAAFLPRLYENTVKNSADETPDSVVIDQESFPDESFRNYVIGLEAAVSGDSAGNCIFEKEELEQITSVMAGSLEIRDLKGIEYFTYLEILNCGGNSIENLNLSHFDKLKELICSDNKLDSLDLSNQTALEKLDCSNNDIPELDVRENPLLIELCCSSNPIAELDISNNTDLQRFEASNTRLTSLSIENHNPFDEENGKEFDFFELENSSYPVFSCNGETYDFDLTALPGSFNIEKATEWNGAEPAENMLNGIKNGDTVTYTYDIGCGINVQFSLTFEEGHDLVKVEDRSEICSAAANLWQCADCGRFYSDKEGTEAETVIGHSYDEGIAEKEASCTEEGVLLKTCTVCGHELREVIEMLYHNVGDSYEFDQYQHWQICPDCEQEIGREDHSFEEGSDVCLVCGETIEQPLHKLVFVEEKAPTCTEEGVKEHYYCAECDKYFADSNGNEEIPYSDLIIEKLEHQYETGFDENEHWLECALCRDKKDVQSHNAEEVRTEPTCCADGSVSNVCPDCGYTVETEVLPATGEHIFSEEYSSDDDQHWFNCINEECTERIEPTEHSYTKLEIVKNPTCSEEGILNHICEICGHTKTEAIPISETHTFTDQYVQLDENTHAKICDICGMQTEAENHNFDEGSVIKEATCADGIFGYTCLCGYHKDEVISAITQHDLADGYIDLGEQHSAICKVCGTTTEPDDHVYDIQIVKASCFASGKLVYTCKFCKHSYEEETEQPTGEHSFSQDYILDGSTHIHQCMAAGCTAVDTHDEKECCYTKPADAPVYGVGGADVDIEISELEPIDIIWPTTVEVVLNPYNMKINITENSHNHSVA
ncbi:MAG: hypothetical protein K2J79_10415, partial [Ruminiclostridium sp.]|nr:hypothetical protein [Ruminiclostridium sp.]